MAERRMFAKTIIDSDAFLNMPMTARLLYYDLGMRADDDGFVNAPLKIMRIIGATQDDMNILIARKFIIPFESGIVVIKHWRINNYLRNDRYNETQYVDEKEQLFLDEKGKYHVKNDNGIPLGIPTVSTGKDSIGKDSIGKVSIGESIDPPTESKHIYGEYKHVRLKESEYNKLATEYGQSMTESCITFLDEYIEMKGYKAKSHYLCIKKWVVEAVKERSRRSGNNGTPKSNSESVNEYMLKYINGEGNDD